MNLRWAGDRGFVTDRTGKSTHFGRGGFWDESTTTYNDLGRNPNDMEWSQWPMTVANKWQRPGKRKHRQYESGGGHTNGVIDTRFAGFEITDYTREPNPHIPTNYFSNAWPTTHINKPVHPWHRHQYHGR